MPSLTTHEFKTEKTYVALIHFKEQEKGKINENKQQTKYLYLLLWVIL